LKGIGSAAVPALTELLDVEDSRLRRSAAYALCSIGPDAAPAVPALVRAHRHKSFSLTRELQKIPARPEAVAELNGLMLDPDRRVSDAAVVALLSAGEAGVKALGEQLALCEKSVAERCVSKLRALEEKGVPALVSGLKNTKPDVRALLLKTLAYMQEKAVSAAPQVIAALDDADPGVRIEAVDCLTRIGPPGLPGIKKALLSKDADLRFAAAGAVRILRSAAKDAVPELFEAMLMEQSRRKLTEFVFIFVQRIGADAVPALSNIVAKDERIEARRLAAQLLARMRSGDLEQALAVLRSAAKDGDSVVREAATEALSRAEKFAGAGDTKASLASATGTGASPGKTPEETFAAVKTAAASKTPEKLLGLHAAMQDPLLKMQMLTAAAQVLDEARQIQRGFKGEAGKVQAEFQYKMFIGMTLDEVASSSKERIAGALIRKMMPPSNATIAGVTVSKDGKTAVVKYSAPGQKDGELNLILLDGLWFLDRK